MSQLMQSTTELPPVSVYLPASQPVHSMSPPAFSSLYMPGPHELHVAEPGLLKPVPQLVHVSVAPVLKVPAWHFSSAVWSSFVFWPALAVVQKEAPVPANLPKPHSEHVSTAPVLYLPASHDTSPVLISELSLVTSFPAPTVEQKPAPVTAYLPTTQEVHESSPPVEALPGWHEAHSASLVTVQPSSRYFPTPQRVHVLQLLRPAWGWNMEPNSHVSQALPPPTLNFPAWQMPQLCVS